MSYLVLLALAALPPSHLMARKATRAELSLPAERYVLDNGLVVLLSPTPGARVVAVQVAFRAGTVHEPAGRAGLAHLVEHVVADGTGPTSMSDQCAARQCTGFNAFTTFDTMRFVASAPPEQLSFLLWMNEERLGRLTQGLTQEQLDRHRKIVLAERAANLADQPYAQHELLVLAAAFGPSHPLQKSVFGTSKSLEAVTVDDAATFAKRFLVPNNAVVAITGAFDTEVARKLITQTLARVPPSAPPPSPKLPAEARSGRTTGQEQIARQPRISVAWNLPFVLPDTADLLEFGAMVLRVRTNGAFGFAVDTHFGTILDGAFFSLGITFDNATDNVTASDNAEAMLRYLTRAQVEDDLMVMTKLAWDRGRLLALADPTLRAALLLIDERRHGPISRPEDHGERHWFWTPEMVQTTARAMLEQARVTIYARPVNPRPPRRERE